MSLTGGLYNAMLGQQPYAEPLIESLNLREGYGHVRLRDAWLQESAEGAIEVVLFTRNGGKNREHYSSDASESHSRHISRSGPECGCIGCAITHLLPKH